MRTEEEKYKLARKRMLELKEFYRHLITYVLVNSGLALLNLLTSPEYLWFLWPLFGWGIGLAAEAFSVFSPTRQFESDWEERKTREIMSKMSDN